MKFIFTLLLLWAAYAHGQYKTAEWTNEFEPKGTKHLVGTWSNGTTAGIVFSDQEEDIAGINVVLCDLEGKTASVFDHTFDKPVSSIIGGFNAENGFTVVYENLYEKDGAFFQEIKSLELNRDESKKEKVLAQFTVANKQHLGHAKFAQSLNLKKSLVFIETPYRSGEKEEITFIVYDENGKEESNNSAQMDLDSKQNVRNYPQVTNNGNIFFLKKDKEKNVPRYFICSFEPSTKNMNKKLVALSNTNITEIRGQATPQNDFLVGGFTASSPEHLYEGYYLFKFDLACIQKFRTQGQFDESTFLKFLSKKEFSKDPVIKDYYIDNITVLPSGKIFMSAESYREEQAGNVTLSNYKDVMLVSFDEAGKFKTAFKYAKTQAVKAENHVWASYKLFPNNDTLVLAHNFIAKTEGTKNPEPVLTYVNVHERYGAKTVTNEKTGWQQDPFFFLPELVYDPTKNQYIALFASFDRTRF
ncbi:MAG TPA: hypothetical protein VD905_17620, partial [Flavobacteriales bacterium]|nr:hypothetical protein [Flavobacteriales bacterium]